MRILTHRAILLFRSDKTLPRTEIQSLLGTLHETRDPSFELNSPSVFGSLSNTVKETLESPIYIDNDEHCNNSPEITILTYNELHRDSSSGDSAEWMLDPSEALSWNTPGEHGCFQGKQGGDASSFLRGSHTRDVDGVTTSAFNDEDFYRFDAEGEVRRIGGGNFRQRVVGSTDKSSIISRSRSKSESIIKTGTLTRGNNDDGFVEETQG